MNIPSKLVSGIACLATILCVPALAASRESNANPATASLNWTPVLMQPVGAPRPFKGSDQKYNLVYDLVLHNFHPKESKILEFAVLDPAHGNKPLLTLKENALKDALSTFSPKAPFTLGPGESGIIWVNISFASKDQVPQKLVHKIKLSSQTQLGDPNVYTYQSQAFGVEEKPAIEISAPLKGKHWVVEGGYSSKLGHRRALFPLDNGLHEAQTYAIDWEKLDDNFISCKGDPKNPKSYVTYGQDVLAVADAVVCGVVNKFKDQVPDKPAGKERISNPGGNSITLDLGNGYFAFYAHLRPGSMLVKEGEKVKRGQKIAEAGNSGNSSGAHLHMHITDNSSPLSSHGVPYQIEKFTVVGELSTEELDRTYGQKTPHKISKSKYAGEHKSELPKDGLVIDFE